MASGFLSNLLGNNGGGGLKGTISDALFGTTPTTPMTNTNQYPVAIQNYLDSLDDKEFYKNLLNQPKETALSPEQYKTGFTQGLNFGVPEFADAQKELKINIPKTEEEIEQAKAGTFNTYPLQAGLAGGQRQGGFFNDLASGYRDNYYNGFSFDNLQPKNNGFATKLGEGLGTITRFIDSPLGRGLIAGGLTSALGYKNGLQEGLTAMGVRQKAQAEDKLYRRDLESQGIDTSDIRGNITSDLYKNLSNNVYRQNNLALKQQTAESQNRLRELQIEKQQILNSTLPEEQKAKLIKLNAEAAHAEEMQLARINYYNNAVANPLGWANYGLKADANERQNREFDAKLKEQESKLKLMEQLVGGNKSTPSQPKPTANNHKTNAF